MPNDKMNGGNSTQKKNVSFDPTGATGISKPVVELDGNPDAQILAKAFEQYAQDGISPSERATIEKLDDLLKHADIVISPKGDFATIAQEDGKTFQVKPKGRSR